MKKLLSVIGMMSLLSLSLFATDYEPKTRSFSGTRARVTQISARTFQDAAGPDVDNAYTISSGGYYLFIENVPFTGAATPIVISSGDVVLDLGGYTLSSDGDDTIGAIDVGAVENVVIKNGSITGFDDDFINVEAGAKGIRLEDLYMTDGDEKGIYFKGTTGTATEIRDCSIKRCTIADMESTGEAAVSCQLDFCQNILIEDCNFLDATAPVGYDAYGLYVVSSTGITVKNCISAGHTGNTAYGYMMNTANVGNIFENCTATGMVGLVDAAYGFYGSAAHGNLFNNCKSMGHQGANNAYGFYLTGSDYNSFSNCYAAYCQDVEVNAANNTAGFYSTGGEGNVWKHCESIGHQGASVATGNISGFELAGAEKQSAILNCVARACGKTIGSDASAQGFYLSHATTVDYCQIRGCHAVGNTSSTAGAAYGFRDISTATTNLFMDNFAFANTDAATPNAVDNYNVTVGAGDFAEVDADIGGILDLANKPLYYNVGVTS